MIILRDKEFSKETDDVKKIAGVGLGVGGVVAANSIGEKITEKAGKKLMKSKITAKDEEAIRKKLLKEAEKQGTKIINTPEFNNSAYTGGGAGKTLKKGLTKMVKTLKKSDPEAAKQTIDILNEKTGGVLKHLGKDRIVMGSGSLSSADVLSHEIGHSKYMKSGRSKNIVAKGAHKLMIPSKIAASNFGAGVSAAHGFKSGRKSVQLEKEGKKESKWDKVKSVAVPAMAVAPLMIAEGAASHKGLRMMKKAGASKELMSQSRKRLGTALATYGGAASKPIISGQIGREAGKLYEKGKSKKEKA